MTESGSLCCSCVAFWVALAAVLLFFLRKYFRGGQFTEHVSAQGKIVVVTGANTGIGFETTRELNLRGAKVYMLCRSEERASEAKARLVKMGCDASRLVFEQCDLSKFASVRACAKRITQAESRLDILINNAGIMYYPRHELTEDGHEMTWHSNHLGPFLLTELLLPLLEKADEARIVNVSSAAHYYQTTALDFNTINDAASFGLLACYARSKLANVIHARELTRRLHSRGIDHVTANSLHPGVFPSELGRHLGPWMSKWKLVMPFFMKTTLDGAQTSLFVALSKTLKGVSGHYFSDCVGKAENLLALDDLACKQLYDYSRKTVGLE